VTRVILTLGLRPRCARPNRLSCRFVEPYGFSSSYTFQKPLTRVLKCVPNGIRTRVAAVKGQCPRPLDDGDKQCLHTDQSNMRSFALCVNNIGARRDRTADLLHAMQALSQLSYSPEAKILRICVTCCQVELQ
jgi:hypothetical protein